MTPFLRRKKQRLRVNVSAFKTLIATPGTTTFTMPAGGRVSFLTATAKADGTLAATAAGPYGNKQFRTTLFGASGGRVKVDWLEKGVDVTLEASFTAQVDVGLGAWRTICNP